MKEHTWKDCTSEGSAIKITPDRLRSKSLVETAQARLDLVEDINEKKKKFSHLLG